MPAGTCPSPPMRRRATIGRHCHRLVIALVGGVGLWAGIAHPSSVDRAELDQIEDKSEEFANQLHDLSLAIRHRDVEAIATHYAPGLKATGWPAPGGAQKNQIKWVETVESAWPIEAVGRFDFLRGWTAYLAGFTRIEDVRLKVKKAHFTADTDDLRVTATVYFSIIGRNQRDSRAWVEAKAEVGAGHAKGETEWLIERFEFTSFSSRVTDTDLFSEVAATAGVFHAVPPFGSAGNPEFAAHGVAVHDVDGDGLLDVGRPARPGDQVHVVPPRTAQQVPAAQGEELVEAGKDLPAPHHGHVHRRQQRDQPRDPRSRDDDGRTRLGDGVVDARHANAGLDRLLAQPPAVFFRYRTAGLARGERAGKLDPGPLKGDAEPYLIEDRVARANNAAGAVVCRDTGNVPSRGRGRFDPLHDAAGLGRGLLQLGEQLGATPAPVLDDPLGPLLEARCVVEQAGLAVDRCGAGRPSQGLTNALEKLVTLGQGLRHRARKGLAAMAGKSR